MKRKLLVSLFVALFAMVLALSVGAVTPASDALGDCVINGEVVSGDTLPITQGMEYTVTDEDTKTVSVSGKGTVDSYTGAIVIPSTIKIGDDIYTVTEVEANVFAKVSATKLYIPDTVVSLKGLTWGQDNGSFANCFNLTEVYIGTGMKNLGRFAFTSIGRSSTVKVFKVYGKVETVGQYTFNCANFASDCDVLFDTSELRRIEDFAFTQGAKAIKVINSEKLEYIGTGAFSSSPTLEYILIPEYCVLGGEDIFNGATALHTVIIRSAPDEIKKIPQEFMSSASSGIVTNTYIKGRVEATGYAVLQGKYNNIYMDSYANAKYYADSIQKYIHNRIATAHWYFCVPYNDSYHFTADSSFNLTAQSDVTEAPHTAITMKGVTTPATCCKYAGIGDVCEVCGEAFNVVETGTEYDESAHNYVLLDHVDPQCVITGLDTYKCSYCNNVKESVIPVLGHDYEQETFDANCQRIGYTNNVCKRCEYSVITDKVEKKSHLWGTKDATLNGHELTHTAVCKYCGKAETRTESLVNKCYIEGYGIFDATMKYFNISANGTITPSDATFNKATLYFPSYVELDGTIVEIKTLDGFIRKSITGIYIPDTVTKIVGEDTKGCFMNLHDLKNLVVGKGITEIEQDAFRNSERKIYLDEFIFKGTITKISTLALDRICASENMTGYEFNAVLTYAGAYVNGNGGTILKEVYITNECDLISCFAFNGSDGLKKAFVEGGDTAETAKELTREIFSGIASNLQIVIKGYVKATGQANLPTNGAHIFFKTMDQAKVYAASLNTQEYSYRATSSYWYFCDESATNGGIRYKIDNFTSDPSTLTFKLDGSNPSVHVAISTSKVSGCMGTGATTEYCWLCNTAIEIQSGEGSHTYDGGVFTTEANCYTLGVVTYTCLDCGDSYTVMTGYDLSSHILDTVVDILFKNGYLANGTHVSKCSGCNIEIEEETPTFPALFRTLGYSYSQIGDGAIMQSFGANREAIGAYTSITGKSLDYGLVVAVKNVVNTTNLVKANGEKAHDYVANVSFKDRPYDLFEMQLVGVGTKHADLEVYLCAYYIIDGTVYYIDNGVAGREAPIAITFNKIVAFKEEETPLE